ncbi:hypothetical protein A1Q1_00562 [Trichosporon asahii var. asahii CBS 2479]|uniref:Uncharacterized protein n=1 Tax=Trichosporon asahii var. asahii (strain ATCC 90039 / CBS 2479 / JCM 2466 / KCTC 7840 / NBRC 103889/ NCYC 2677 / UAMH 7654) TaxID=1186058 RepID=J4UFF3_TRIAS|nr:hypothetical protein A1Q1_00562 [Trichosporon asahii var. asahii CBS 2479]EJT50095.1 hypothetical protein A1Q1_00562 [Trichosporon asahii var. asahii CBS 2479]
MPDTAHRPSYEELQQRLRDIEIKQEQGVERLAAMRAAGFRMDAELRELRAALQRLNETSELVKSRLKPAEPAATAAD